MIGKTKTIAIVIAAVIIASAGAGLVIFKHPAKDTLTPVYLIKVKQNNGTYETVNLSTVGGYAYVPSLSGGQWTLDHPLSRIVSLIPSVTSTLYALHAYGDLVGVDQYSIYPVPTKNVTVFNIEVGSIPIEPIANLTPDAVITTIGGFTQQDINQVVNVLGIPYIVINPGNISQIEAQNVILGSLTGNSNNASIINDWMNVNLENLQKDLQNITAQKEYSVFYDLGAGSGGLYTAGPGTFIQSIFNRDHLVNIVNISGYPDVPLSYVYNATPDYVLLDQYVSVANLNTSLPNLQAVKNGSYFTVANDTFFDEPNFRTIYTIFWLGAHFYPENVNMSSIVDFNTFTGLGLKQSPEAGVNG